MEIFWGFICGAVFVASAVFCYRRSRSYDEFVEERKNGK